MRANQFLVVSRLDWNNLSNSSKPSLDISHPSLSRTRFLNSRHQSALYSQPSRRYFHLDRYRNAFRSRQRALVRVHVAERVDPAMLDCALQLAAERAMGIFCGDDGAAELPLCSCDSGFVGVD